MAHTDVPGAGERSRPAAGPRHQLRYAAIAVAVLATHAGVLLAPLAQYPKTVVGDLATVALSLLAGVSCLLAGRRRTGSQRWGWTLLGAGMFCWSAGDAVWSQYEVVQRVQEVPFPSAADVGYLAMVPLALAGLAALVSLHRGAVRTFLDGLIISGSLLFVSWATVLEPAYRAGHQAALARAITLAYPIGDIALATLAFVLASHAARGHRWGAALLGAGALALAVADSGFAYLSQTGAYSTGNPIDNGWVAGFLLIALGGWYTRPGPAQSRREAPLWIALPYLPLSLAVVSSGILYAVRGTVGPFLYILSTVLVVLVVARQLVALRDNVALTRRLERAVAELSGREEQLRHLAFHDPLTGLANRALFHDRTEQAMVSRPQRSATVAVLYIDLDGFKQVNDEHGHAVGDALLVAVGQRLRKCLRPGDTLARLGGDEFGVLLEQVDTAAEASMLADRIVAVLGDSFGIAGNRLSIGASVGVALCEPGTDKVSALLRRADVAMYAAKVEGKGRCVTFPPATGAAVAIATG